RDDVLRAAAEAMERTRDAAVAAVRATGHERMMRCHEGDAAGRAVRGERAQPGRDLCVCICFTIRLLVAHDVIVQPPLCVEDDDASPANVHGYGTGAAVGG